MFSPLRSRRGHEPFFDSEELTGYADTYSTSDLLFLDDCPWRGEKPVMKGIGRRLFAASNSVFWTQAPSTSTAEGKLGIMVNPLPISLRMILWPPEHSRHSSMERSACACRRSGSR